jgi:hypothetical protein
MNKCGMMIKSLLECRQLLTIIYTLNNTHIRLSFSVLHGGRKPPIYNLPWRPLVNQLITRNSILSQLLEYSCGVTIEGF